VQRSIRVSVVEVRPVQFHLDPETIMMMDMTAMGSGMMLTMGIYHLAIFIFAVLGIAASIKYLRS
jgi:hypothetical protein